MAFLRLIWNKTEWIHQQIIVLVWKVDIIYPSLNIKFSKKSSPYWLIYIQSRRKLWFDTVVFSYPKPSFECDSMI